MKKAFNYFVVPAILTALVVSGCVSTKYLPSEGSKTYPSTEKIIAYRDFPPRGYEILGIVTASGSNKNKMFSRLKEKAMSIGAHAIIMKRATELSREYTSERRTQFKTSKLRYEAVAIRFKEPE